MRKAANEFQQSERTWEGIANNSVHLIAARLRFLLNPKSSGSGSER